ncbi:annexin A13-like [Actinia tenebrosa]|uniref:Annexin A13-like n=1 Tax=Actinia tenebrosa TaxID=6105 RepID=A0A6P8IYE5_ACTTE|nr:annexin A13-like [Actinia tenebrosa]XP_031572192.1 annexin A13-like [Actinia tenebrosa]
MGCSESIQREVFVTRSHRKQTILNWDLESARLHKIVNAIGTDENAVIQILATFKCSERQRIILAYKKTYGKDLISVLESELSLGYQEAATALLYRPEVYDAKSLHQAIEDHENDTLIEIICSRKTLAIEMIREAYQEEFTCSLENDLLSIQDQDLRELLIKFCTINTEGVRSKADRTAAQERAIRLHSYGDLVELLCEPLGRNQLKATFEELETLYMKPIDVYIDNQYKGKSLDFRRALKAYVACTISPPAFFCKELNKALEKNSRSKKVLRIVITRSETDLYYIIREYLSCYSIQLTKAIQKKCLPHYTHPLKIILAIRGQYQESAVRM